MATLYKTDGSTIEVEPKSKEKGFQLEELYEMIGCDLIEIVRLPDNEHILIVDEEGAIKDGVPYNDIVSFMFWTHIFGNALYCKTNEIK